MKLNPKIKAFLIVALATALFIGVVAAIAAYSQPSTVNVPAGLPTPTPTPTATPTPTPAPTNTFTLSATLNDAAVPNPAAINLPSAYIGTQYTIVYTFTSTANQPITVTASAPGVTGNQIISWDPTSTANGYSVFLGSNGAAATMTMYVTLQSTGGSIPLVFTSTP
jgi:hypothetical protein